MHDDDGVLLGALQDKLYEKLPLSFLKAKAAYALGIVLPIYTYTHITLLYLEFYSYKQ